MTESILLELSEAEIRQLRGLLQSDTTYTTEQATSDEQMIRYFDALLDDDIPTDVSMNGYQNKTERTAIYPDEFPEFITPGLVYVALGLAEAGEVQEKVKKAIREDDVSYLNEIPAEAGDVLWYLARVSEELRQIDEVSFDGTLADIASGNLDKLFDRQERGVLEGSGDDR